MPKRRMRSAAAHDTRGRIANDFAGVELANRAVLEQQAVTLAVAHDALAQHRSTFAGCVQPDAPNAVEFAALELRLRASADRRAEIRGFDKSTAVQPQRTAANRDTAAGVAAKVAVFEQ